MTSLSRHPFSARMCEFVALHLSLSTSPFLLYPAHLLTSLTHHLLDPLHLPPLLLSCTSSTWPYTPPLQPSTPILVAICTSSSLHYPAHLLPGPTHPLCDLYPFSWPSAPPLLVLASGWQRRAGRGRVPITLLSGGGAC